MAGPSIRVTGGDWGGSQPADVEAVARSVVDCFPVLDGHNWVALVVEPTATTDDAPIVLFTPNGAGELVVRLSARATQWARFAYQFAHEYCHVLADPTTWTRSGFLWLEESLCEAASLFALRTMAVQWREAPPYPNWREYAPELDRYVDERLGDPCRSLPSGTSFSAWLAESLPLLSRDAWNRNRNTVIARELVPVFLAEPEAWRCVGRLHEVRLDACRTHEQFLAAWAEHCDVHDSRVVRSLQRLLTPSA